MEGDNSMTKEKRLLYGIKSLKRLGLSYIEIGYEIQRVKAKIVKQWQLQREENMQSEIQKNFLIESMAGLEKTQKKSKASKWMSFLRAILKLLKELMKKKAASTA